jgi:predicted acetyltransferase
LTLPAERTYLIRMLEVTFRAPEPGDEAQLAEAQRIMAVEGFDFAFDFTPGENFEKWLELQVDHRLGKNVASGWVASTFELALVEGQIAGRLSVRHALNDVLLRWGGHLGYGVLPPFRGQGVAKRMLQRGLQLTAQLGIQRVLVTCDEDNAASRRIIEGGGGVYESSYVGAGINRPIRRYWFG